MERVEGSKFRESKGFTVKFLTSNYRRVTVRPTVASLLEDQARSFSDIAREVGVTRERVRQLAKSFGVIGREMEAVRRKVREAEKAAAKEARLKLVLTEWERNRRVSRANVIFLNRYLHSKGRFRCGSCNNSYPLEKKVSGRSNVCRLCASARIMRSRSRKMLGV